MKGINREEKLISDAAMFCCSLVLVLVDDVTCNDTYWLFIWTYNVCIYKDNVKIFKIYHDTRRIYTAWDILSMCGGIWWVVSDAL